MKLKKSLAVLLSAVLMLSFLPMLASASEAPTALYVGEKDKSEDNLIRKYDDEHLVRVYSANDNTAYYTVDYEKGVGYVLTFFNNYSLSEPVERSGNFCGIYCDGDLTIRVDKGAVLDMDRLFGGEKANDAYGIYVKGALTIESADKTMSTLTVYGDKTQNEADAIGIYAESLSLYNIALHVAGGNVGIAAGDYVAMINTKLYCNNTADMKNDQGEPKFSYGIVTENLIQVGGELEVGGALDVTAFDFHGGKHKFDENIVVYLRNFAFKENDKTGEKIYAGLWHETFDLFINASLIPSCVKLAKSGTRSVVSVSGNKATLTNRGNVTLKLVLCCGRGRYAMDTYEVGCSVAWWQWIPYFFSGAWLNK